MSSAWNDAIGPRVSRVYWYGMSDIPLLSLFIPMKVKSWVTRFFNGQEKTVQSIWVEPPRKSVATFSSTPRDNKKSVATLHLIKMAVSRVSMIYFYFSPGLVLYESPSCVDEFLATTPEENCAATYSVIEIKHLLNIIQGYITLRLIKLISHSLAPLNGTA